MLVIPADIVANVVVAPARAANSHFPLVIPYELPALKPIHPHQSINKPMQTFIGDPIGKGSVPRSKRPILGPMNHAATKPDFQS